jgi:hypothetical protein
LKNLQNKLGPHLRILIIILIGLPFWANGQVDLVDSTIINVPSLKVIQAIRPTFFEFKYVGVRDYPMALRSDEFGDSKAEVGNNRRLRLKLNVPLTFNPKLRLALGLSYAHEQFRFEEIQDAEYPLYQRLEDKSLRSIGMRFYLKRDLNNGNFLKSRFGVDLNGDKITAIGFSRFFKGNISVVYGRQKDPYTELGLGLYAGYDLGIPSIFPIFNYNKILNSSWLMELVLPKSAKIIYTPDQKTQFSATLEVSGASYHMQEEVLPGYNNLELRQSELRFHMGMNREIYDFLWASVGIGALRNLNLFVSQRGERRRDAIIFANPFSAYTIEFSVYLVPPRKLYNKVLRR